jgi:serine/threonine-protein kinase
MMEDTRQLIGQLIGEYRLTEYLGYGLNSHVFKSRKEERGREVAIKLLSPPSTTKPEFERIFYREISAAAKLRHPNIPRIYDFGFQGPTPYTVMEYIEGPNLKDLLNAMQRRLMRVPLRVATKVITDVSKALSYAHAHHVTHQNLKPSNILLEKTGRVLVSDFRVSNLPFDKKRLPTKTLYAPPATLHLPDLGKSSAQIQLDIYAIGAIYYHLATGSIPYVEGQEIQSNIEISIPPPRLLIPEIPEHTERIILKAMANDPSALYEAVGELLKDLTRFSDNVRTTMLPSSNISDVEYISGRFPMAVAPDTIDPKGQAQISLHFLDTGQIISLESEREYIIGRRYKEQPVVPDIDLTPFKAFEWGISRLHAKIDVGDHRVTITDLGSSNGTYHAGHRIPANQPYGLEHGDIVFLGKLRIQVLIY